MRLFSWMQDKLNAKQGSKNSNTTPAINFVKQETREEFSDWPHGLLAIGTFGNNELKESAAETYGNNTDVKESHGTQDIQEDPSSSEDDHVKDFTPEEVDKLQKELTKLLSKKSKNSKVEKEIAELPLDRFLNCPSSLEISRRISNALCIESDDKEEDIDKTISIILGRCKEICANKSKKNIGVKSLSFLFKKMFVCSSGFAPSPSLRNSLQESRMEKLLRTLLKKKISTQSSSRTSSMKKILEDKYMIKDKNEDEKHEKIDDGCKWVKTDSEYIVLEI